MREVARQVCSELKIIKDLENRFFEKGNPETIYIYLTCWDYSKWNQVETFYREVSFIHYESFIRVFLSCFLSTQRCAPASIRLMDNEQFQLGQWHISPSAPLFSSPCLLTPLIHLSLSTFSLSLTLFLSTGQVMKPAPSMFGSFTNSLKKLYVTKVCM